MSWNVLVAAELFFDFLQRHYKDGYSAGNLRRYRRVLD